MAPNIFYYVYVSSSVQLLSSDELLNLLTISRNNNSRDGITGMLLHKDGNFMQAIEGPEKEVRSLLEKIYKDTRHRGILMLIEGYSDSRQFSEWSMGFHELNSPQTRLIPGYSEFLNTALTPAEFESNPTLCQHLLLSFRNSMS